MKFVVIGLFLASSAIAASPEQGTHGGGDATSYEFTVNAERLLGLFRQNASLRELVPELDVDLFAAAVKNTVIESKDELFLEQREVDAINYPLEGRIEVSRSRWTKDKDTSLSRMALVAHEFLGVLKKDDVNYRVSYRIYGWFMTHGKGSFDCHIEGGMERRRTDSGVKLERHDAANATVYELFVDGAFAMDLTQFRDGETFNTSTYDISSGRLLSASSASFLPGAAASASYIAGDRYVFIQCNDK